MPSKFLKFFIFILFGVVVSSSICESTAAETKELPFGDQSGFQLVGAAHTTTLSQSIPKEISEKIKENVVREMLFRKQVPVGEGTNIVQLSMFLEGTEGRMVEFPVPTLFLSGTQSTTFPKFSRMEIWPFNTIHEYKIEGEKKPFKVVQRTQPNIDGTVNTLVSVLSLVDKKTKYGDVADEKLKEIQSAQSYCKEIIKVIENFPVPKVDNVIHGAIVKSLESRNQTIIRSLESYDLYFALVPEADKDPLINQIKQEIAKLCKKQKLEEIFISKSINLACSEQLAVDMLDAPLMKVLLKEVVSKKDTFNKITFHIHTTKAPCKVCILKILYNLEQGNIKKFFSIFPNAKVQVVISYSEPYSDEDGYGFFISHEKQYAEDLSKIQKKFEEYPIKLWVVPYTEKLFK